MLVDVEMVRSLVDNLISNALRHATSGGRVKVAAHLDGQSWTLSVEDDGTGVRAELRTWVFERFTRASRLAIETPEVLGSGCPSVRSSLNSTAARFTWMTTLPTRRDSSPRSDATVVARGRRGKALMTTVGASHILKMTTPTSVATAVNNTATAVRKNTCRRTSTRWRSSRSRRSPLFAITPTSLRCVSVTKLKLDAIGELERRLSSLNDLRTCLALASAFVVLALAIR